MKRLRKLIFWLHLIAGLTFGAGIFLLAGTGVLMSFEHQIIDLVEHGDGTPPAADAKQLPVETLVTSALKAIPDASPTAVTVQHDPGQPVSVAFGKERRILVNAYTGDVVGKQATSLRSFYRTVLELHRWLALSGDWRPVGRGTTGVVVVGFAVLIIGGLLLWIPRKIRWASVRPVLMFDWKLRGKALDWNWHNVIGFWSLVPLLILTLTGMVMSHTWANNALFRLAGDQPPAPRQENATRDRQGSDGPDGQRRQGERRAPTPRPLDLNGLNLLWDEVRRQSPDASSITMRLGGRGGGGGGAGVTFTINDSEIDAPYNRRSITLDRSTGEVLRTESFDTMTPGRRLRAMVLPIHRGEILGITGQITAGLACIGALVLVWTGFALSIRRFWNRFVRRARQT